MNYHHIASLNDTITYQLVNTEIEDEELRIAHSSKRAKKLVDAAFCNETNIQLIFILPNYFKKKILRRLLLHPQFKIIDSFCTDSWQEYYDRPVTVFVIETFIKNLRLTKLIEGICYQDFPQYRKSTVEIPIIFYNGQKDLLLTIYDDQIADSWSSNPKIQQDLKKKFSSWILH